MSDTDGTAIEVQRGLAKGCARLTGRRILVVGGGQDDLGVTDPPVGNGRAMSILFAREGARVVVADIDPARARSTVDAITQEGHGGNAHAVVGDAAQEEGVDAIFDGALEALGGLDGVVLNVGVGAGLGLRGTTVDHWDRVMATNLRSQFLGCKRAISTMERGSMVLVSSVAAQEVMPVPAYGASKAALESLCRQAAIEGAPAIRVNLLLPGLIDTPLGRRATERTPRRSGVRIPLRRQGSAWEVASAALFLLSDDASYITGQRLVVDGGLTVAPRG